MKNIKKQKVFVGLSGGVDSSVAALLLKRAGYDVTGVFMRCYNIDGCAERDAADARRVAEHIKIPFYVFDFEEDYKREVVEYMVKGYREGITPNPDVMCNKHIKFGLFLRRALELGADFIATGHYVRLSHSPNTLAQGVSGATPKSYPSQKHWVSLFVARDSNKDQSYFLWTLTQYQLKHCLFPIGDYLKSEVRKIAKDADLPTADKKDSQGICFLGKVTIDSFLKNYIPEEKGSILTTDGKKIGEHEGAYFYTIGQRHGLDLKTKSRELGLGGKYATKPHYIASKDVKTNTVIVAEGEDNPLLYKSEIGLNGVNFINSDFKEGDVMARVRYRQPLAPGRLLRESGGYKIVFKESQKFVALGQSAVFYSDKGEMLGGGVIV